jgi:HlyD family secretion protein
MPIRLVTVRILGPAVVCLAAAIVACAPGISGDGLLIASAQAQSKQEDPLEKARTAVETLINRLRGRDMPEGIVKSNGRLEATQVDVAAKSAGDGDQGRR